MKIKDMTLWVQANPFTVAIKHGHQTVCKLFYGKGCPIRDRVQAERLADKLVMLFNASQEEK